MLLTFHLLSFSYEEEITKDGILYTTSKSSNTLIVGTDKETNGNAYIDKTLVDIKIPNFIDCDGFHYKVTIIGKFAFRYVSTIQSIFIPNTIQQIKFDAIAHNINLTKVTFEKNSALAIIGRGFLYETQVTDIKLPPSVSYLYLYSFGLTNMKSLYYCGNYFFTESTIFVCSATNELMPPEHIYVSKNYPFTSFGPVENLEKTSFCDK